MEPKELSGHNRELSRGDFSDENTNSASKLSPAVTVGELHIPDYWEEYECLLSEDLFTVLALDMWKYDGYDDEIVKQHYDEISRFLNSIVRLKDMGITYLDKYPKLNIELARHKVETSFKRLVRPSKRKEYFKEVLDAKKREGREQLETLIKTIVADDKVTVEESLQFIEAAVKNYFTETEAAGILLEAILDQGFTPVKPFSPDNLKLVKLLSTDFERSVPQPITQVYTNVSPVTRSSQLMTLEDLLDSGILKEYLQDNGKTEGKEWVEFYRALKENFQLDSISQLKALIDTNRSYIFRSSLVDMIDVEGGSFMMGSSNGWNGQKSNHLVTLNGFLISKTQVTQELWKTVMGSNPSKFKGSKRPVETVSWYDTLDFCNKLSEKEGLQKAYLGTGDYITFDYDASGYRLPTEAEWEYAAKGGNLSKGFEYSGSNNIDDVAWYEKNSGGETKEVASKQPNELGIYDMSGNVWEWCWDRFGDYTSIGEIDPQGPDSGAYRVLRGGGWSRDEGGCRITVRRYDSPVYKSFNRGFRLARSI